MKEGIINASEARKLLDEKKKETSDYTEEDDTWNEVVSYIKWGIQNKKDRIFVHYTKMFPELRKALEKEGYRVSRPCYMYIQDFTVEISF